jgi:hypothetical protein
MASGQIFYGLIPEIPTIFDWGQSGRKLKGHGRVGRYDGGDAGESQFGESRHHTEP